MKRGILLLLVLLSAGGLRLARLDLRPMHTDEAVHAIKFGALLEQGAYRYDRAEYHGPTLNYLTLIPAWLSGKRTLVEVDEVTLRVVPAAAGILLVVMLLWLEGWPTRASLLGGFAAALSPALVFYSRYYIQEMLLVLFTAAFLSFALRALRSGNAGWAAASGAAAGLMYATKETSIVSFGAALAALFITRFLVPDPFPRPRTAARRLVPPFLLSAAAVILLFFSSFGTHPEGIVDAFSGFDVYLRRAGDHGPHIHPWYYYLSVLFWTEGPGFLLWSEGAILLLGVGGFIAVWKERKSSSSPGRRARLFLAVFTLLLSTILSVIPYKTPWVILTPFAGLVFLAGVGADRALEWKGGAKVAAYGILLLGALHLLYQSVAASFRYEESPENPYVYAQTLGGVKEISLRILELKSDHPGGVIVQAFFPGHDYWPFPWYLRRLEQTGWWDAVPDTLPRADVYLVPAGLETSLASSLDRSALPGSRPLYVPLEERPLFLRPGREIRAFVRYGLLTAQQRTDGQ
jgi:uncharacterized protein (TIGR03663 family)